MSGSVMNYAKANPDTTKALLAPIRVESWAIALRQGQDELKGKVNAFLKDYRAKGGFEKLADKHLGTYREMMKQQGIPFIFDVPAAP